MSKITRFIRYWWESATDTKEIWDMITWILAVIAWLIVVGKECIDFPSTNWKIFSEPVFEIAAWTVAVVLTLRAIFWLPFLRDEAQERIIESLRKLPAPTLEIEIIHPADLDILTSRKTYRIKVKNTHPSKAVKNLKVWLCEIKWPQSIQKPMIIGGIIWPHQLPEKGNPNHSLAHELAGDSEKEFDLMFISTPYFGKRIINLAPFRPKNIDSPSLFKSVDSDLNFDIEILPKDDSKLIFKFKVTGGEGDVDTIAESYIVRVPPLLPEDSVTNQVENVNSLGQNLYKFLPVFEKVDKTIENKGKK
jgi:hypothetical protein